MSTAPQVVDLLERDPAIEFQCYSFPDYCAVAGRMPGGGHIVPVPLPADELIVFAPRRLAHGRLSGHAGLSAAAP